MSDFISRGFGGRRQQQEYGDRLPPGQYAESGWPVLTAGPTPIVEPDDWSFRIDGMVANEKEWSTEAFKALPVETITRDIHCVTKWSKFDGWCGGVSLDVLLEEADARGDYAMQFSYRGCASNVPDAHL